MKYSRKHSLYHICWGIAAICSIIYIVTAYFTPIFAATAERKTSSHQRVATKPLSNLREAALSPAPIIMYTNKAAWQAASPSSLTTLNFEGVAPAGGQANYSTAAGLTLSDVRFLGNSCCPSYFLNVYSNALTPPSDPFNWGTGDVLIGIAFIQATLPSGIKSVGMDAGITFTRVTGTPSPLVFVVSTTATSQTFTIPAPLTPPLTFVGFTCDDPITNIVFSGSSLKVLDNFSFGRAASCGLICATTVPSTGTTGTSINFQGSTTAPNCTGTPTYDWNFGDGTSNSSSQNPKHLYVNPGTYTWTMTTSVAGATACVKSGNIVVSPAPDTDGDGLPDDWETNGIDFDGDGAVDFDLPGADPLHKDIFVEADYMETTDHSHKPMVDAILDVVAAFANAPVSNPDGHTGVNLHVQVGESIPEIALLEMWADFDTLKSNRFGKPTERSDANHASILAAKRLAYHYCIFGHQFSNPAANNTNSGRAEIGGNDFLVTLGAFTNQTGTRIEQAATFMHELGHNLGLLHGGNDNVNYKPNYISIMNYSFQLRGISNLFTDLRIDYSHRELPPLWEDGLSEVGGIGDGADITYYYCAGSTQISAIGSLPIDWNCNNFIKPIGTVQANINRGASGEVLSGFNDWANLQFNFKTSSDFADGTHLTAPPDQQELDAETAATMQLTRVVTVDIKPNETPNSINLQSNGATPVLILSSLDFSATSVIPQSVRFANSSALRQYTFKDLNNDGLIDLLMHFETATLQLSSNSTMAALSGSTTNGLEIAGADSVKVVK
jgi:PKD repeat protein